MKLKPWGYTLRPAGGDNGSLYCVNPDCGAVVLRDGRRFYQHVEGCETGHIEDILHSTDKKGAV